ncbi:energy transducer TonB [Dyella jejuensis]|uniref:Energy transducer TonB n=1 Tax=Dyella jejuensis TaxID=1432009 RepID=A0ABW8JIT5_9GAMM
MPSVSLAVVRRAHPDRVRVAALSAAITLNLAVLLVALRPLAPQVTQVFASTKVQTVRFIEPPPKAPPPPDIQVKPLPRTVPVASPVHVPAVQTVQPPVMTTPPTIEPSDNSKPVTATPAHTDLPMMAPGVVSLAYRSSPLRFPVQAMRMHMAGTVVLRVLVDETGKPLEVVVEHGSGHALLDKSAREQVLANWQFQPAVVDGHAVKAWARVPVSFALQEL